jgi:hypothetical protein
MHPKGHVRPAMARKGPIRLDSFFTPSRAALMRG